MIVMLRIGDSWKPFFRKKPNDSGWGRGSRPAIYVSQEEAKAYATWLSAQTGKTYRLPSESEWEYAARAGTRTRYSWGDEIGVNRANCDGCGSEWDDEQTAPVGSFAANAFGLFDMHGNVWRTAGTITTRARPPMAAPGRAVVIAPGPWCAAAPGSLIRGICVPRTATGSRRRGAALSAFVLSRI